MKRRSGLIILFLCVTLVSVVWHFPASWVLQQSWIKQSLPNSMSVTEVSGRWWHGRGKVSWQNRSLGFIEWQWHPFNLLTGSLAMRLALDAPQAQLKAELLVDSSDLVLKEANGTFNLSYLSKYVKSSSMLQAATGDVVFKDFSMTVSQAALTKDLVWPKEVKGQVVLVDFDMMGVHLPLMKISPEQQADSIILKLNGVGKQWQLNGNSVVTSNHRFQNDLVLSSTTPQSFPSWGSVVMQKTAPNKAVLKNAGRW